jgi:hypothetical protein
MEALKLILDFLSDGGHAIITMILLAIFFAGITSLVRAFKGKSDDGESDNEY